MQLSEKINNITYAENFGVLDGIMENWDKHGIVHKDLNEGQVFKVNGLSDINKNTFLLSCLNGVDLACNLKKEKKFFEIYEEKFNSVEDFTFWLKSDKATEFFATNEISVQCIEVKDGLAYGSLIEAHLDTKKLEFFEEIKNPQKVYEALIKDKNLGGFLVSINGINAFLPGSLASANKITNFDVLIGKKINVMLEDYIKDGDTFIVSNKKYIQTVLPQKIKSLQNDRLYSGTITGTSKFGIFIEFEDICTGLLHLSEMSDDTKEKFENGFYYPSMTMKFFIKEVAKDNRIILSEFEYNNDTMTLEDFKQLNEGRIIEGRIMSIPAKQYGYFVNFGTKDVPFIGLLHNKEINGKRFRVGDKVNCLINDVDLELNKIYLKYIQN